ncbi:MAG: hypothetical protein GQF41_1381 [Candidatus Rifleibacterium amylolyticum]|nr:MAG: hypothetical protein GQF41_1381 [Candidatus Rifleibacterium amylolyticum]
MPRALEHFGYSSSAPVLDDRIASLDRQIRQLARQCKMPSSYIELDYQTEPSFFAALANYGYEHDLVLIQPDNPAGLTGLGIRSVRRAYLGGCPADIGYLHHLRFHPSIRGGSFLARGYREFRKVFAARPLKVTLTSILEDNAVARQLLESNRAGSGMPTYRPVSRFLTLLIPLTGPGRRWPLRRRERVGNLGFAVRMLTDADLPALMSLFELAGRHNDGMPAFAAEDFCGGSTSALAGLQITDMVGVFAGNELLGAIGIWNQQAYRQIVLSHLCPSLSVVRKLWNLGRGLWGECPIPLTGGRVNNVLLDPWVIVPGREREIMPVLLKAATKEAKRRGALFAAFGVSANNPALAAVDTLFYISYWSIIYQVFWPETAVYGFTGRQLHVANLGSL